MAQEQVKTAFERGFHVSGHKTAAYSRSCPRCRMKRCCSMPITMAGNGEKVIIQEITGGRTAREKLVSMGFGPGEPVEIINNNGRGKLILGRGYSRLAIGRGLAQKILVEPKLQIHVLPSRSG